MSEANNADIQLPRSTKQLRSSIAVKAYQKEWFQKIREKTNQGIPFAICAAGCCEETLTAFGMPVVVIQWWMGLIAAKRMSAYYGNVLAERGWDMNHYDGALGLAVTIDNNPETAPWGGLPKPAVIIGSTGNDPSLTLLEIWAREAGCHYFPLEQGGVSGGAPIVPVPRWWERIRDHWDEMVNPHRLDLMVKELKELIRFIENTTGLRFSIARLAEVNNILNEQEDYFRKARDLIAETVPCPATLADQLSTYTPIQWHRGTAEARDLAKMFYEEVKERADNGVANCPNEKIRLIWLGAGLWTNTAFYQYFEEKYGATFVASIYLSLAADAYARTTINNDPLRAIASRNIMLGMGGSDWLIKEAKLHKCNGAVGFGREDGRPSPQKVAFEKAGIPVCEIPGSNVDLRQWDDEKIKSIVSDFIETRLLS
jgi:hypothetical protein